MGELSPWHLLIVAAAFVLLFGAKRLPDAARSVGKSLRIFKTEVKGLHDDEPQPAQPAAPQPPQAIAPAAPTPSVPPTATTPSASDTTPR
jgi:sec-independent protein translocase protein TatA